MHDNGLLARSKEIGKIEVKGNKNGYVKKYDIIERSHTIGCELKRLYLCDREDFIHWI